MNEEKIAKAVEWFAENKKICVILSLGFWVAIIYQTVNLFN